MSTHTTGVYPFDLTTLVGRMRKASPAVDDYMSREIYLADAEVPENVNESQVISKCLDIILDELGYLGIYLSIPMDNVVDNKEYISILTLVRDKLTTPVMLDYFKSLDYKSLIELEELLLSIDDESTVDLCDKVVEYMVDKFPHSQDWNMVLRYTDFIHSGDKFKNHIQAIYDMCISTGMPSMVPESHKDVVIEYVHDKVTHRDLYLKLLRHLMSIDGTLDRVRLLQEVKYHDTDLVRNEYVLAIAKVATSCEYTEHEKLQHDNMEKLHHERSLHHIEHYLVSGIIPDRTAQAMLVADLLAEDLASQIQITELIAELKSKGHGIINQSIVDKFGSSITPDIIKATV